MKTRTRQGMRDGQPRRDLKGRGGTTGARAGLWDKTKDADDEGTQNDDEEEDAERVEMEP